MGTYASAVPDIHDRVPFPGITASSVPSATEVDRWVTHAEARLHATLKGVQLATPVTDSDGIEVAKDLVMMYAEGRYRMALAASGHDGDNDDGKDLVQAFEDALTAIRDDPTGRGAEFGGGSVSDSARRLRSHVTDHPDGQTVAAGDFDPTFNKRDGSSQF
jgi:hypothetical protein